MVIHTNLKKKKKKKEEWKWDFLGKLLVLVMSDEVSTARGRTVQTCGR